MFQYHNSLVVLYIIRDCIETSRDTNAIIHIIIAMGAHVESNTMEIIGAYCPLRWGNNMKV